MPHARGPADPGAHPHPSWRRGRPALWVPSSCPHGQRPGVFGGRGAAKASCTRFHSASPGSADSGSGAGCAFVFSGNRQPVFRVAVPLLCAHQRSAPAAVTKPHRPVAKPQDLIFSVPEAGGPSRRGGPAAAGDAPRHSSSAPCSAPCGLLPPQPPPRALRSHTALGASASTREVGATRFPRDRASVRIAFLCRGRDRCVVTPRGSNLRLSKAGRTPAPSAPREPTVSSCLLPIF